MKLLEQCPDILTVAEAADFLRIPLPVMEELLKNGKLKSVEIGGIIVILRVFLIDFLENSCLMCYNKDIKGNDSFPDGRENTHLDNCISLNNRPFSEGETEMATKISQAVMINGSKVWIRANTMQEFTNKVIQRLGASTQDQNKHAFADYAWNWYNTYSAPNVETATATTYKRQIRLYLIPAFEGMAVEDITVDDVQRLFNGMSGAKTTKDKARMVLNQILDAAVEDKLISTNPLKSRRLKVTGKSSKTTPPYSVDQMRYLVQHIGDIKNPTDRAYMALQALHPLRLEEVLGLAPEDVDTNSMTIHVRRAVTHPKRNQPEIKDTKTESSHRIIGLSSLALPFLQIPVKGKFLFGGEKPLSYTQIRRMCGRIQKDTGFSEGITPIRFRTTVLTDLYDQTKDIKLAPAAAGHTTSAMTLKYYVKGRASSSDAVVAVDRLYMD